MIYLAVSIDVEPDCSSNWNYSNPLTFNGVGIGIDKILQPLFNKYGVKPTYLINNVVMEDKDSVSVFKHLQGNFELGTHLHCEFIEPQKIYTDYAGKAGRANQCELDTEIEMQKMVAITEMFKQNFGYSPRSFRAGRFSAGKNTIRCLENLGYWVDSSVTPGLSWKDKTRRLPVDYTNTSTSPFFTDHNNFPFKSQQQSGILEFPVTIIESKRFGLLNHNLWLRPFYSNIKEMKKIIMSIPKNAESNIYLNMMFHNVEVLPGLSPYCKTKRDCERYIDNLERFFELCISLKAQFLSLKEIYMKHKSDSKD